jgi:hypothetical protein
VVATATAAIVLLTPANFYQFQRRKFNFQQKLAETKIVARGNVKKIKAKIRYKAFKCSGNDFLPKFVNNGESRRFFGRC